MFDTGTIQIAKIAGIPIRLHWSFILVFFWVGFVGWRNDQSISYIFFIQLLVIILFLCVTLHEYGHSLIAQKYGHKTRDIVLTPIGGIARLESMSEHPKEEAIIAIAGPIVNLIITGMLAMVLVLSGKSHMIHLDSAIGQNQLKFEFIRLVMMSNFYLATFNVIPAFPMDGGRILRALLSLKLSRLKATLIAARLGQVFAVLFLIFALSQGHWLLCLISIFILITASHELKQVKWESTLVGKSAHDLVNIQFHRLEVSDSIQFPLHALAIGIEKNYLVFDGADFKGYLSHSVLQQLLKIKVHDAPIVDFAKTDGEVIQESEALKDVYNKMQLTGIPIFPVVKDGIVIGAIEESQIRKFVDIQLETK